MNTTTLVILFTAFVLLYGAIKNKNPLAVIKSAITNKPISNAPKIQT